MHTYIHTYIYIITYIHVYIYILWIFAFSLEIEITESMVEGVSLWAIPMREKWKRCGIPASHQALTFSLSNVGLYSVQMWWTMLLETFSKIETIVKALWSIGLDRDTYTQHPFVFEMWQMLTSVSWLLNVCLTVPSRFLRWCLQIADHTGFASLY